MTPEFQNAMVRRALAWLEHQYANGATDLQLRVWHMDCRLAIESVAVWPWTVTPKECDELDWSVTPTWRHRMKEYNAR